MCWTPARPSPAGRTSSWSWSAASPSRSSATSNDLTTRERLELFVQVCQAVQHAHQKGIIHRDLKPSNVLVTLHDGVPVPKIIDFGVAKATSQQLTEQDAFTGFGQMVGTPLYMSPEQAELNCLDVDTRSDIYSLGVLLYELLTGTTPFDRDRLREAGIDEVRRVIREEEPSRPSTRISTLGEAATTVSMHRKTDPAKLSRALRGELDWIVMKALEKDRTRRYQTANDFARDIQRHLADEPIEARPPALADRGAMGPTASAGHVGSDGYHGPHDAHPGSDHPHHDQCLSARKGSAGTCGRTAADCRTAGGVGQAAERVGGQTAVRRRVESVHFQHATRGAGLGVGANQASARDAR